MLADSNMTSLWSTLDQAVRISEERVFDHDLAGYMVFRDSCKAAKSQTGSDNSTACYILKKRLLAAKRAVQRW